VQEQWGRAPLKSWVHPLKSVGLQMRLIVLTPCNTLRHLSVCVHSCRYVYVEMDTMDQNKAAIPHHYRPQKDLDESALVHMHVTCVRVPGLGVMEFLYDNTFPHDANTTITVLHRSAQSLNMQGEGELGPAMFGTH